jgi:hypothetical protein
MQNLYEHAVVKIWNNMHIVLLLKLSGHRKYVVMIVNPIIIYMSKVKIYFLKH